MRSNDHRASSLLALLLCLLALPLSAATATGSAVPLAPPDLAIKHRLLLADQGACRLMLVDQNDPTKDWTVQLPPKDYGHDLQLIGNDQVLVSIPNGWQERSLKDGSLVKERTDCSAVISVQRLADGSTLVAGQVPGSTKGSLLSIIGPDGAFRSSIEVAGAKGPRMVRVLANGSYLIALGNRIIEAKPDGSIAWEVPLKHNNGFWKALRQADGTTVATTGHDLALVHIAADGHTIRRTAASDMPAEVQLFYPTGLQVLANGHRVLTNFTGHGNGNGTKGIQLLEFDVDGKLVWYWKQDPARVSSLIAVIVLDGLDTTKLHDERTGIQAPVETAAK